MDNGRLVAIASLLVMTSCAPAATTDRAEAYQSAIVDDPGERSSSVCTAETTCTTSRVLKKTADCTFFVGFDGSGVYSPDVHSNVGVLYDEMGGPAATSGASGLWSEVVRGDSTRAYVEGVPSIVATDSRERVNRGRSAICQHLSARPASACDIVLVGYSRGAVIANQIAWVMNEIGCPDGTHRGAPIKLVGAFDPVGTQMGLDWVDEAWTSHAWQEAVPSNVETYIQVYKSTLEDPRGGVSGLVLTTTLLDGRAARSSCSMALGSVSHPEKRDWHHGEVGHFDLPRDVMKCAFERAHVRFGQADFNQAD